MRGMLAYDKGARQKLRGLKKLGTLVCKAFHLRIFKLLTPRMPLKGLDPDHKPEFGEPGSSCTSSKYWGCKFGTPQSLEAKATCIDAYRRHKQNLIETWLSQYCSHVEFSTSNAVECLAQDTIPADRLLIFNISCSASMLILLSHEVMAGRRSANS